MLVAGSELEFEDPAFIDVISDLDAVWRHGEIWTDSGGADYAAEPRSAVNVQDDKFDATHSVTVCVLTTNPIEAPLFRLRIEANERNGLHFVSSMMLGKIATVPKDKPGSRIGMLGNADLMRLNRAMLVFLGLARPPAIWLDHTCPQVA